MAGFQLIDLKRRRSPVFVTDIVALTAIVLLCHHWFASMPAPRSIHHSGHAAAAINDVRQVQGHRRAATPASPVEFAFLSATDLRVFYQRHTDSIHLRDAGYFLSQALEECFEVSHMNESEYLHRTQADPHSHELYACRGFVGQPIRGDDIVDLLTIAADAGDPRAQARMLLFRDIGEPLDETRELVARLTMTNDPYVMRDVEAYLGRGQLGLLAGRRVSPVDESAMTPGNS